MTDPVRARPGIAAAALQMARRYALLLLLVAGAAGVAMLHPEAWLSYDTLAGHRADWTAWAGRHFEAALGLFFAIYVATKVFFVPGGPLLTAVAGLLLGTIATAAVSTVAGTLAAVIVYEAAHHGVGNGLRAKALPFVDRLGTAFRTHGFSYLLTLRLIPVVPFWLACLVPAILGMRRRSYLVATFLGNIPANFLYASLGGALGAMLDQGRAIELRTLTQPRIILPLAGLAALSLAPVVYAKLSGRGALRVS
jgi:uncharacterized membrane protein YdjX (TVP38/TMEM64 family)